MTNENGSQIIGAYLTEDDEHIFMNEAHHIGSNGFIPYDISSLNLAAFKKQNIQTASLPSVSCAASFVKTIHQRVMTENINYENIGSPQFPVTEYSYITETPVATLH